MTWTWVGVFLLQTDMIKAHCFLRWPTLLHKEEILSARPSAPQLQEMQYNRYIIVLNVFTVYIYIYIYIYLYLYLYLSIYLYLYLYLYLYIYIYMCNCLYMFFIFYNHLLLIEVIAVKMWSKTYTY